MRKMISEILSSDQRIEVIGTARNGEEGLVKIKELQPDVVTLDVEMPIMDGMTVLAKIMEEQPLPVVMLASETSGVAEKTVQAISNGAVDFIAKPSGAISLDIHKIKEKIITKVVAASQVNFATATISKPVVDGQHLTKNHRHAHTLIAIGTSTGGPRALQQVLCDLPGIGMPPIVIVQHMPPGFTLSLAKRLNGLANIHVKEAEHGEKLKRNTAYIAPGDFHMTIRQLGTSMFIELTKDAPLKGHRPSVDYLFQSIAELKQINKIAVVLTGMGNDGAAGITQMKRMDRETIVIAESKESAVIYGMPKAAAQTNLVNEMVLLQQIGKTMVDMINHPTGR